MVICYRMGRLSLKGMLVVRPKNEASILVTPRWSDKSNRLHLLPEGVGAVGKSGVSQARSDKAAELRLRLRGVPVAGIVPNLCGVSRSRWELVRRQISSPKD